MIDRKFPLNANVPNYWQSHRDLGLNLCEISPMVVSTNPNGWTDRCYQTYYLPALRSIIMIPESESCITDSFHLPHCHNSQPLRDILKLLKVLKNGGNNCKCNFVDASCWCKELGSLLTSYIRNRHKRGTLTLIAAKSGPLNTWPFKLNSEALQ